MPTEGSYYFLKASERKIVNIVLFLQMMKESMSNMASS